jgi:DNA-binding MarR family transcriptional regulator
MTGGWRPFTDDDIWVCPIGHQEWKPTEADRRLDEVLGAWAAAALFRRLALRALRRHGLTFAQWRVLQATERLVREKDDAVSQLAIARRIESDEGTVSKVVARLMDKGLLDVGPDAWGWSYRILVTSWGEQALKASYEDIMHAAALAFGAPAAKSKVGDGGSTERLDGDFGQELGVGDDTNVG